MSPEHVLLLERAERTFGKLHPLEAIPATRAITGPWNIPDSQKAAGEAMKKLRRGIVPTQEELIALEYVIRIMRPAPLVIDGVPGSINTEGDTLHTPEALVRWESFRNASPAFMGAIGRLEHPDPSIGHVGTGFLVAGDVLATNHHVLEILSGGSDMLTEHGGVKVYFRREAGKGDPGATIAKVIGVVAVHPSLDIALLRVDAEQERPMLELDLTAEVAPGYPVVVVGYPAKSSGLNPLFADQIFKNIYGMKRAAMGEVIRVNPAAQIYHDCSTLGGNSGSPVISLMTGKVIGIHKSGAFSYRNEAEPASGILLPG